MVSRLRNLLPRNLFDSFKWKNEFNHLFPNLIGPQHPVFVIPISLSVSGTKFSEKHALGNGGTEKRFLDWERGSAPPTLSLGSGQWPCLYFCFVLLSFQHRWAPLSVSLTGDKAECGWQGTVKCDLFSCSLEFALLGSSGWYIVVEMDTRGLTGLFAQVFLFLLSSSWLPLPNSFPLSVMKKAAELGRSQANLRWVHSRQWIYLTVFLPPLFWISYKHILCSGKNDLIFLYQIHITSTNENRSSNQLQCDLFWLFTVSNWDALHILI